MRKLPALVTVAVLCVVGSAQARKANPQNSPKPANEHAHKPPKAPTPGKPNPAECVARSEGYEATGTLISAMLTPQGHGRYSGTLAVKVTKADHHVHAEAVTYTLSGARVKFHHGVNAATPAVGSRVKLSGKITELPNKHCSRTGFTSTITVEKADIRR
jgi:hypothetical protein